MIKEVIKGKIKKILYVATLENSEPWNYWEYRITEEKIENWNNIVPWQQSEKGKLFY